MEENIDFICRQTDYSKEEAEILLQAENGDAEAVILKFMSKPKVEKETLLNPQQTIFKEIGKFMQEVGPLKKK
jgi:hypothetical protein